MSISKNNGGRVDYMDQERFLKEYELKVALEFSRGSTPAEWADGGHRFWGSEDDSITLETADPIGESDSDWCAALSPDGRLLAVSSNAVIRLYDVKTKHVVSQLKGHTAHVGRLHFAPMTLAHPDGRAYTLVSNDAHRGRPTYTFIWHLDSTGTHVDNELRRLPGDLTSFGVANPVSNVGKQVITIEKNMSTQQGMRPPEEMPRVVVRDTDTLGEMWRLTGHQDAIMWAGWSPDNTRIAEASWDQTFGIWDPAVRDRAQGHLIGLSGGQNWMGDFSADGKYVVFSGGMPTKVAVYDVETGVELSAIKPEKRTSHWVRELQWSPTDYCIAAVVNQTVVLWRPLESETSTTVLEIETDGTMLTRFNDLTLVEWVDEGRKLLVRDRANTIFVWDVKANKKWRFQRPFGVGFDGYTNPCTFCRDVDGKERVLSLDGDAKVRYWNL